MTRYLYILEGESYYGHIALGVIAEETHAVYGAQLRCDIIEAPWVICNPFDGQPRCNDVGGSGGCFDAARVCRPVAIAGADFEELKQLADAMRGEGGV